MKDNKEGYPGSGVDFMGKPVKDWVNVPIKEHCDGVGKRKDSTPNDK